MKDANEQAKTLLLIFPHPDDESVMAGGLVQKMKRLGWKIAVLSVTGGERGRIFVHGHGRSLREIRENEFCRAVRRIGGDKGEIWNFPDGRLSQKDIQVKLKANLIKYLGIIKPDLIVTYDPSGLTGHPDHIALSGLIFKITSSTRHTGQLWWVLPSGRLRKLSHPACPDFAGDKAVEAVSLSLGDTWRKIRAISAYRSQGLMANRELLSWVLFDRREIFEPADRVRPVYKYYKYKID